MDPELLNLFAAAAKRQGGNSRVLSALNNPWAAFLSGAYTPPVGGAGGAGGSLWATYANNPDYPELQPIVQAIAGGADKYQTQEAVNRAVAGGGGGFFSADNLARLAADLQKEYSSGGSSGNGGKQDAFSKAGIRNPADLYTLYDVPVPAKIQAQLNSLIPGYTDVSQKAGEKKTTLDSIMRMVESHNKKINQSNSIWGEDMTRPRTGSIWGEDMTRPRTGSIWGEDMTRPRTGGIYGKSMDDMKNRSSKVELDKKKKELANKAYQASSEYGALRMEQDIQGGVMDAYRKGVLRAYAEQGRTPAKDQMAQVLSFLAKTGK